MMVVRPVTTDDLDALMALARKAGVGVTSLQPNETQLAARIDRSMRTLHGQAALHEQGYLFVLEDTVSGQVVGVSGIEVAVGMKEPWYNFRCGTLSHMSPELGVNRHVPTLFLSNDHTGYSELCTLFLDPDWRHSRNGQLLSKSRFLFLAAFKDRFAKKIVAEMRGVSDNTGKSPFWESLGRHFFQIDFARADYLTGTGQKSFIAELMPRFPVYIPMLTPEAQAAIGKVHPQTEPARAMLEAEGFRHEGYVDIFDGGATLEVYVETLRIVRDSRLHAVAVPTREAGTPSLHLVSNEQDRNFRVLLAETHCTSEGVQLSAAQQDALQLSATARVRATTLYA